VQRKTSLELSGEVDQNVAAGRPLQNGRTGSMLSDDNDRYDRTRG